jgi:uncharacterized protein (DUF2237 family)
MIAIPPSGTSPARKPDRNVLGGPLDPRSNAPLTGFFRDGLVTGDRWCLCAARWLEAARAGRAPPAVLEATHEKSLDVVPFEPLEKHATPPT